ncbi:MerR family transcriptional regulator [Streptomyces sp. NPDC048182]|uniref:DNA polymerase III subunit beta family protein n=1 Tax=Streptomyces sp. NPDC048182 TaxID=3365507 RepID=UPI003711F270
MENDMRSIGEMARDSGLGVSALRFYDRAGVLVPARVDPASGYRWYADDQLDEARLLARLRRTGMPLADVRLVLAGWSGPDSDLVRGLIQAHLRRLEQQLSDARDEFSTLRAFLDDRETPMTAPRSTTRLRLTVVAAELAAALDAVRFAAGDDPDLPMLTGVLFDTDGDALRLVATDRYRLAVARAGVTDSEGTPVRVLVPRPLADAMRALLPDEGSARLGVDGDRVTLEAGDRQAAGQCLPYDFPDYRRLVSVPAGRRVLVDVPALRESLRTGPVRPGRTTGDPRAAGDVSLLRVSDGNTLTPCAEGDDAGDLVAVNRAFLLDALDAGARDRLAVEVGAPTAPLAVRRPDDEQTFSLLMPVRLED